jgi:hypothetical protein
VNSGGIGVNMGEATYYMKGNNCSEETLEKIREFFKEGARAGDWWQEHRDYELEGRCDQFWSEFEVEFPLVTKYTKCIGIFGGDCNNDPAGQLDFGDEDEIDDNLELKGSQMKYSAYVWHFADWNGLMEFLQEEFGLKKCRWLSDENIDPSDLL